MCNAFDDSTGNLLPNTKSKDTKRRVRAGMCNCIGNSRDNLVTGIDLRVSDKNTA
jgi:hypothetical protein